jgi:hypothetical protein
LLIQNDNGEPIVVLTKKEFEHICYFYMDLVGEPDAAVLALDDDMWETIDFHKKLRKDFKTVFSLLNPEQETNAP